MKRYGMVIDLRKCVGCKACTVACKQYHGMPGDIIYTRVLEYETGQYPHAKIEYLPTQCMHCDIPSCVRACPSGATYKTEDGLVENNSDLCYGCRACIIACPYEASTYIGDYQSYYSAKGDTPYEEQKKKKYLQSTIAKCVFCADRIEKGQEPACVQTCPASARFFGDLNDPASEVSLLIIEKKATQYRPETGNSPKIYYIK